MDMAVSVLRKHPQKTPKRTETGNACDTRHVLYQDPFRVCGRYQPAYVSEQRRILMWDARPSLLAKGLARRTRRKEPIAALRQIKVVDQERLDVARVKLRSRVIPLVRLLAGRIFIVSSNYLDTGIAQAPR